MSVDATKTDAAGDPGRSDEAVVQLRAWGTDRAIALPAAGDPAAEWTIGAAADCWLALDDPKHQVSRRHAALARDPALGGWVVRDRRSKNGIRQDGVRRDAIALAPGVELGIGGLAFVAESARLVELRGFVARLLGWSAGRATAVDLAMRAIRTSAARREALVLAGDDDLVAIAHQLHRRMLGDDRPFVVCDPRRQKASATVRSAANRVDGLAALRSARGGTLCLVAARLPHDLDAVLAELRDPSSQTQLIACGALGDPLLAPALEIPPLQARGAELDRVVVEYAADAQRDLGADLASFGPADGDWVRAHETTSLADLDKAVRRIVALRSLGNVHRAAAALGMSHVALAEWVRRRNLT